jgi:hypothetical protein
MGRPPDFTPLPGDEAWWASLFAYTSEDREDLIGCQRIHPKMTTWVESLLASPPALKPTTATRIRINEDKFERRYPIGSKKLTLIQETVLRIKIGMLIRNPDATDILAQRPDLRQAYHCLSGVIGTMEMDDILSETTYRRLTRLGELVGPDPRSVRFGKMVLGYLFQTGVDAGQFDDL